MIKPPIKNWGLYFIGAGSTGYASKVTFDVPSFSSLKTGGIKINIDGTTWASGIPYVHNGSSWVEAKAVYIHNGSSWIQV